MQLRKEKETSLLASNETSPAPPNALNQQISLLQKVTVSAKSTTIYRHGGSHSAGSGSPVNAHHHHRASWKRSRSKMILSAPGGSPPEADKVIEMSPNENNTKTKDVSDEVLPGGSDTPPPKKRRLSVSCNANPSSSTDSKKLKHKSHCSAKGDGPSGDSSCMEVEMAPVDDENSLASSISCYDLNTTTRVTSVGSGAPQIGSDAPPPDHTKAGDSDADDEEDEEREENVTNVSDDIATSTDTTHVIVGSLPPSSPLDVSPSKRRRRREDAVIGGSDTDMSLLSSSSPCNASQRQSLEARRYPLRSRIRLENLRQKRHQIHNLPKDFGHLPPEVYSRIFHYLSIQDVFRIQLVNRRFLDNVITYLKLVKRINFSSGLPFAFLPKSLDDRMLKRMLQRTPQVTHILGFYPRTIYDSVNLAQANGATSGVLTYPGIMAAFRSCTKLRSVEIMDVELMSRVVNSLPRVKFHGMFRNSPDNWDQEFAIQINSQSLRVPNLIQPESGVLRLSNGLLTGRSSGQSWASSGQSSASLLYPIPRVNDRLILPTSVHNLTKLDLVSVCINAIPRLENIKYLHFKWVRFSGADPFNNFHTPKLQSFVMNNCVGPIRALRYIRLLTFLARAPQLSRMEIVSTRFVEGLMEHIIEDGFMGTGSRAFRGLQRLVMAGNRDLGEGDIGFIMLGAQTALSHLALQLCHSRDSLFLTLVNAGASFPKLDTVVLGYQDPFQSRLSQAELTQLDLLECFEPVCHLTDQGIAALLRLSPRLASLHIRQAPYLENPSTWDPALWSETPATLERGEVPPPPPLVGLRSLTLESCHGIRLENLEQLLNRNNLMPQLDTLVLRDMFPVLPKDCHLSSTWPALDKFFAHPPFRASANDNADAPDDEMLPDLDLIEPEPVAPPRAGNDQNQHNHFWENVVRALRVADRLGGGPLGLGPAGNNVAHVGAPPRPREYLRPIDVNAAVRTFRYRMQLYRMLGGGILHNMDLLRDRQRRTVPVEVPNRSPPTQQPSNQADIASNSVAGPSTPSSSSRASKRRHSQVTTGSSQKQMLSPPAATSSPVTRNRTTSGCCASTSTVQTSPNGAVLKSESPSCCSAPESEFVSRGSQTCLCGLLEWQPLHVFKQQHSSSHIYSHCPTQSGSNWQPGPSKKCQKIFYASRNPCLICSPNEFDEDISSDCPEPHLTHHPRTWAARDASVDTTSLRLHLAPPKHPLTLDMALQLTTLHLERVGITHLVVGRGGAPRLKNVTVENCPEFQSIVLLTHSTSTSLQPQAAPKCPGMLLPALRRLRIVRCPKVAIYHLLYLMSSLYPHHDDNLYITYRPFGEYNPLVEKVLWENSKSNHVLISHDYKQRASEREMEEQRSSFDQLFREVLNFSETLIRRDILTIHEAPDINLYSNGTFMRSEHGTDWDMTTDIPWISEVCCSMLPNDLSRTEQADQLYELLAEIQTAHQLKLRRRGIHYHVQCRDIIKDGPCYLPRPYTDAYLSHTHPLADVNAFYTATPLPRPPAPQFDMRQSEVISELRLEDDSDSEIDEDEIECARTVLHHNDELKITQVNSLADSRSMRQWRLDNDFPDSGTGGPVSDDDKSSSSSSDCSPFLRCDEGPDPDDDLLKAEEEVMEDGIVTDEPMDEGEDSMEVM